MIEKIDSLNPEELIYIDKVLEQGDDLIVFDVGVNEGQHLSIFLSKSIRFKLYAFEPNDKKYKRLTERFKTNNFVINCLGLDNIVGKKDFYKIRSAFAKFEGLSSCFFRDVFNRLEYDKVTINCDTIDNYCKNNNIDKIDFLKIDTEGNELNIIKGAKELLQNKAIRYIQFEYGLCWKDSKASIGECIEFLNSFGYKIYQLDRGKFVELIDKKDNYETNTLTNYFVAHEEIK